MTARREAVVDRTCRRCNQSFEGRYNTSVCPPCRESVRRACYQRFREKNPDYWKQWWKENGREAGAYLAKYGLTVESRDAMIAEQGGGCAICGASGGWKANAGQLVVDHCHRSTEVRGMLCPSCNRGLGQFEDDPARLRAAADYLERHQKHPEST